MPAAEGGVELLRRARVVLLIDWPSRDVPDTLARAGLTVVGDEGPRTGHVVYKSRGDEVLRRSLRKPPTRADIVYAYRPVGELTGIVDRATALGARAVWVDLPDHDSARARQIVESAGLLYIDTPSIADAARAIG